MFGFFLLLLTQQQIHKQDTQPSDCKEYADPEHDVGEDVVSPVINEAPPKINWLFQSLYFNNDASRVFRRIDMFFQ